MKVDRTLVVATIAALVVVGGAIGVLGLLDTPSGTDDDGSIPTSTATPYDLGGAGDGGDGGDGSDGATADPPPFEMRIESIESCGQTCRDVTATLVNNQERQATGVTVHTQIYAGEDTEGDVVWEGTQDVGTLDAGAEVTDTKRVELGYMEAMAVQQNDGKITILLTVETDRRTVSFVEHRDVS